MGIGDRLRQLIKNKGVSAYDVSHTTGISQGALSRILNGITQKPSIHTIEILADYFNASPDWLLNGEGAILNSTVKPHSRDMVDIFKKRYEDADNTYKLVKRQGELILEYGKEIQLANKQIGTMLLMIGMLTNELKKVDPQNKLSEKASKFLDSQLNQINTNNHGDPQNPDNDKD